MIKRSRRWRRPPGSPCCKGGGQYGAMILHQRMSFTGFSQRAIRLWRRFRQDNAALFNGKGLLTPGIVIAIRFAEVS